MFKRTYKRNIPLLAGLEFTSYFGITSFWILFFIQNDTDNDSLDIEKIWTPYYVGEKSRNKKLSGTGLGLSIVKKICETQGYSIDCIFKNNKIEFKVLLPIQIK